MWKRLTDKHNDMMLYGDWYQKLAGYGVLVAFIAGLDLLAISIVLTVAWLIYHNAMWVIAFVLSVLTIWILYSIAVFIKEVR